MQENAGLKRTFQSKTMAKVGLLGAISFILMYLEIPLWFAPGFYKIDFSEVSVLIGAFALGPIPGVAIEFIKIVLHLILKGTTTAGVGDFANFFIGCAYIVPAALIYRGHKTMKGALMGTAIGTVCMTIFGSLLNAFVLLPVYATAFGMPLDQIVEMGTAINPAIDNLGTVSYTHLDVYKRQVQWRYGTHHPAPSLFPVLA